MDGAGGEAGVERDPEGASGSVSTAAPTVDPADAARRAGRRELTITVLIALLGGVIAWAAAGRPWITATIGAAPNTFKATASGGDLSGALTALALTGLAGALALLATRRVARRLVGVLLIAAGVGLFGYAVDERGSSDASRILAAKAAAKGFASGAVDVHTASWWLAAAFGGVLVILAGLAAVGRSASWPGMSSRYESAAAKAAVAVDSGSSRDLWDALDRGEDPTAAAGSVGATPGAEH